MYVFQWHVMCLVCALNIFCMKWQNMIWVLVATTKANPNAHTTTTSNMHTFTVTSAALWINFEVYSIWYNLKFPMHVSMFVGWMEFFSQKFILSIRSSILRHWYIGMDLKTQVNIKCGLTWFNSHTKWKLSLLSTTWKHDPTNSMKQQPWPKPLFLFLSAN